MSTRQYEKDPRFVDFEQPTQNSRWLRKQKCLDSGWEYGYNTSNIDYIWSNYKTGQFMVLEEKRKMKDIEFAQKEILKMCDFNFKNCNKPYYMKNCQIPATYMGFYLIQFSNTHVEDGNTFINYQKLSSVEDYIRFLQFDFEYLVEKFGNKFLYYPWG